MINNTLNIFKHQENKRKRVVFSLFLFSLILLFYFFFVIQLQILNIEDLNNREVRAVFPLREREIFTLIYTHSVDLLPVYEVYFIQGQRIYLAETHFYNFGAGMGLLEGRGAYTEENGLLKVLDINEEINPFILRTGIMAEHQLLCRGKTFPLLIYFGPDARLNFKIRDNSIWTVLKAMAVMKVNLWSRLIIRELNQKQYAYQK